MFAAFFDERHAPPRKKNRRKRKRKRRKRHKHMTDENASAVANVRHDEDGQDEAGQRLAKQRKVRPQGSVNTGSPPRRRPTAARQRPVSHGGVAQERSDNPSWLASRPAKPPSQPWKVSPQETSQRDVAQESVVQRPASPDAAGLRGAAQDLVCQREVAAITTPRRHVARDPNLPWADHRGTWLLDKSKKTRRNYEPAITQLLTFLEATGEQGALADVRKVKLRHLQQWMEHLTQQEKTSDTRRYYVMVLKSFWKSLMNHCVVPMNIVAGLRLPQKSVRLRRSKFMSADDVNLFLHRAKTKGCVHRCLLGCMYFAGLRVGEVVALKKADVAVASEEGRKRLVLTVLGKGAKCREICVGTRGSKYMRKFFRQLARLSPNDYLFPGATEAGHRGTESVYKIVKKYAAAVNVPDVTPHWLRHAFATHAFDAGCPIAAISRALGHSSIKTTETYIQSGQEPGDFIN